MSQEKKFNNILNECLDRILKGETVEDCLQRFPEHSRVLEPLLRTAQAAKIATTIQPRSEFKARARYEFQSALREMETKKFQRRRIFNWHWQWQSGWAVALVVVMVVVLGGGGTVAASSNSMPDEPLYSVKLASEQVQLAATSSEIGQAELNAKFANRRTEEIVYMASKDNAQEVQVAAQRLNTNLSNITSIAAEGEGKGAGPGPSTAGRAAGTSSADSNGIEKTNEPSFGIASAPAPMQALAPSSADASQPEATVPPVLTLVPPASVPQPSAAPVSTPSARTETAPAVAVPSIKAKAPDSQITAAPSPSSNSKSVSGNQNTRNTKNNSRISSSDREKLKKIIIDNYNERKARLEEALKKASPQVRPAIRQAIVQSENEFEKALRLLEQSANSS
jgi:hypothetical protein